MLAKKPEDRPQTAVEIAGELERFTSDADLVALAEASRTSLDMPSADVDVTDDVSLVVSRVEPEAHVPARRPFTFVALAGFFLTLLAAVVYYMVTNNGVVQIEVFDDSIKVAIDDRTVTVNQGNDQPIKLRAGGHKLVVSVGKTDLITDNFEIRRNGQIVFKVKLLQGKVVVRKEGKEYKSAALPEHRQENPDARGELSQFAENKPTDPQIRRLFSVATPEGIEFEDADIRVSDDQSLVLVGKKGEHLLAIDDRQRMATAQPVAGWRYMQYVPGTRQIVTKTWGHVLIRDPDQPLRAAPKMPHAMVEGDWINPAISPDGKFVVTRAKRTHIQLWNPATLKPLGDPIEAGGYVNRMHFTSDSKYLCVYAGAGLRLWDPRSERLIAGPFPDGPYPIGMIGMTAYDPVGDRVANIDNNDHSKPVDLESRVIVHSIRGDRAGDRAITIPAHSRRVFWAGSNHLIVWGARKKSPEDVEGYFYETYPLFLIQLDGDSPKPIELAKHIYDLVLTPDGRHVIGTSDKETVCWKVGQTKPLWRTAGRVKEIRPTNECVLLRGFYKTLRVRSVATGEVLQNWDDKWDKGMATHLHGDRIWLFDDEKIEVWGVGAGDDSVEHASTKPSALDAWNDLQDVFQPTPVPGLRRLELPYFVVDVSADEKTALVADSLGVENIPVGAPRIWSLETNREVSKLPALKGFYLRFVPGERPLCMAGDPRRQEVRFWDIETGSWHGDWIGHDFRSDPIYWPIFSPDGATVSIVSLNGEMQFWNLRGDRPAEIKPPENKPLPKSDAPKPFYERQFSSDGKFCFAVFDGKLFVLDPATAAPVAGPFPHYTARNLGISWPSVLYNSTSETLVTIESSDEIKPATLRFRSAKKNWAIAHSVTVTGKVGSVSFLGPNYVLSGGLGMRKAEWDGQTAQHISTIVPIQPGDSPNQVLERDAYTYAFEPDGKQWVGMNTSSVYTGHLGQKKIAWRKPLPQVFRDNNYVDYQISIENSNWVVTQRTRNSQIAVAAYTLDDGRLLLDKKGLRHAVHVKSTIALGREVFRYTPQVAKTLPAIDLRPVQKILSVSTEGRTAFEGNGTFFAKAQLSKDTKTALVESGAILQMWNLETGQFTSISEWGGQGGVVGFVPDANLAWHAENGVEFWDLSKSARTDFAIPHLTGPSESTPVPPAVSEDGKLLATQADVGKFRLWSLETQKPLSPVIEAGTLLSRLTFSPNGKWLFTGDKSGWSIWDVATQKRVAGPLMDHLSDRNTDIAVSPDSSSIATIEGKLPSCEVVIRVAQGETWKEHKRIPISNPIVQAIWIDSQHLAIVLNAGNQYYVIKVISIEELEVQDYGYLRTFDKIKVAPDSQHFVVSNYAAVTCWKLGRKEHLWKIGTSEAGRSHDVHFGKDWVLLHEKGGTTGARPAIVRSLNNGNEVFRKEDAIATAVSGANICLVDATGIEVWQVDHDELRSP